MRPDVKKILTETDLCVLCTSKDDVPDASLMLYAGDDSGTKLYMLTLEDTDKHRNIVFNPNVSILIDTRAAEAGGAAWIQALTIQGEARILSDPDGSKEWISRLTGRHGQLANLAGDRSVRVIEVRIRHILFLQSVDEGCDVAL